uniref:Uncharacterized protein n=1 Tax=Anguilla anguilla TaxID=7936 RepID=A0A0E9X3V6_ANGAN
MTRHVLRPCFTQSRQSICQTAHKSRLLMHSEAVSCADWDYRVTV